MHITDGRSVRGLWEQGFYGKGSLSRSEPNWMKGQIARANKLRATSEELTRQRREERQQAKWERARKEREAIDQKLLEEAKAVLEETVANDDSTWTEEKPLNESDTISTISEPDRNTWRRSLKFFPSPVGPIELLSLPNSLSDLEHWAYDDEPVSPTPIEEGTRHRSRSMPSPVGPIELLSLPNSSSDLKQWVYDEPSNPNPIKEDMGPRKQQFLPPVGPTELLLLPNSSSDLEHGPYNDVAASPAIHLKETPVSQQCAAPTGPLEILALPNSLEDLSLRGKPLESRDHAEAELDKSTNGYSHIPNGIEPDTAPGAEINDKWTNDSGVNGRTGSETSVNGTTADIRDEASSNSVQSEEIVSNGFASTNGAPETPKIKRQKSVRFSPTVEQNTFIEGEPPNLEGGSSSTAASIELQEKPLVIQDQEHFQLMMEEAFFLSYGLGALKVLDSTNSPISNEDLFYMFRRYSHFTPVSNPILSPDDPFVLNYVVYHHYRSLGWCVRGGAKFSCDFLLYNRGPVFSHAEFAIIIIPSYTDPYWSSDVFMQNYVKGREKKSWSWMHCINRVISQVKKKLVLVYVDVPPPVDTDAERKLGIDGVLGRYKVREFVMRRWLSNRERGSNEEKEKA